MMTTKKSSSQGFTLIESVIAMAILGITMLGLIQLFAIAIRQNSFVRNNTMAVVVAQQKLEELQTDYNRQLENGTPPAALTGDLTVGLHASDPVTLESAGGNRQFQIEWTATPNGSSIEVEVTVSPAVVNDFESKTLSMTAVFSP